jgi:uncharacterized phage protein (TIGR01671 family)
MEGGDAIMEKYRAWHKKEKAWLQDVYIHLNGFPELPYIGDGNEAEDIVLMLSTGRRDIHGKEIFKSDILMLGYSDGSFYPTPVEVKYGLHSVGYDDDCATIYPALGFHFSPYPNRPWSGIGETFNWGYIDCSKVIGNIYEHSELLEQGT